jgi:hypothetical protein
LTATLEESAGRAAIKDDPRTSCTPANVPIKAITMIAAIAA